MIHQDFGIGNEVSGSFTSEVLQTSPTYVSLEDSPKHYSKLMVNL